MEKETEELEGEIEEIRQLAKLSYCEDGTFYRVGYPEITKEISELIKKMEGKKLNRANRQNTDSY